MTSREKNRLRLVRRHHGTVVSTLLDTALAAGATVRSTKSGLLLRCPNGSTVGMHCTPSDHRAGANTAAALRRALTAPEARAA